MGSKVIKICKCGKEFISYKSQNQIYCSKDCSNKYKVYNNQYTNKNRKIIYICKQCGKKILGTKCKNRNFCSKDCYYMFLKNKPIVSVFGNPRGKNSSKWESRICKTCGKSFLCYKNNNQKYCSVKCIQRKKLGKYLDINKYEIKICKYCQKEFQDYKYINRIFCSKKCKGDYQSKYLRGKNNPRYKKDKKKELFKNTIEWKEWREAVFERDNYTCQWCNKYGDYLEPHHLKSKQCFPELVYEIDNGITLCRKCHRKLHKLKPANNVIKVEEYPLEILINLGDL